MCIKQKRSIHDASNVRLFNSFLSKLAVDGAFGSYSEASGGRLASLAYPPPPLAPLANPPTLQCEVCFCDIFIENIFSRIFFAKIFGEFFSRFFLKPKSRNFFPKFGKKISKKKKKFFSRFFFFFGRASSLVSVYYVCKVSSKSVGRFRRNRYRTDGQTDTQRSLLLG